MKERLNALQVALDNEMKEHKFYLQNAGRTKNPVGKAMFQQIASEELEHYERLKQLHENWKKDKKWPETVPLNVKDTPVKTLVKDVAKKAPAKAKGDADDLKAVRTAIEFEANGTKYYTKLSEELTDQKEKAFFKLLANIEREHYASLKDTEEYLTDPVSWFRKKESAGLDGA
ncbi:MAG: ferritin family protein [Deltaproteobacteria bacterium]|jgi:rubrerythrin|nr:ferritin family protein [Deltaproteobacteria bacterium]